MRQPVSAQVNVALGDIGNENVHQRTSGVPRRHSYRRTSGGDTGRGSFSCVTGWGWVSCPGHGRPGRCHAPTPAA